MHEIFLIVITKLNGGHVGLKQMSVVENVILPPFEELVQSPLSSSLFVTKCPSHLVQYLS